jgi:hypothetical protein
MELFTALVGGKGQALAALVASAQHALGRDVAVDRWILAVRNRKTRDLSGVMSCRIKSVEF